MIKQIKKYYYLQLLFLLFLSIIILPVNISSTKAAAPEVPDVKSEIASFINPDNAKLKDELIQMLQDDTNKQELQQYILATRPVIEKYKSRFEKASNASLWAEENIPVVGHLISNVIMSTTNYFYQNELKDLATTDIAKKFDALRASGIHIDLTMFQQAASQYVVNKGIDFSLMLNLQQLINEKSESVDFIRSVVNASGTNFEAIDIGTALPKL